MKPRAVVLKGAASQLNNTSLWCAQHSATLLQHLYNYSRSVHCYVAYFVHSNGCIHTVVQYRAKRVLTNRAAELCTSQRAGLDETAVRSIDKTHDTAISIAKRLAGEAHNCGQAYPCTSHGRAALLVTDQDSKVSRYK